MGRWPEIAFCFALVYLESRFPVANAIERGIVSAEQDGDIVPGQRPIRSHSLAHSGASGQVGGYKHRAFGPTGQPFDLRRSIIGRTVGPLGLWCVCGLVFLGRR